MTNEICIVGCGSSKLKGRHEAKNLYNSYYFKLKKKYAQQNFNSWLIISAKHGIIHPKKPISNYDKNLKEFNEDQIFNFKVEISQQLKKSLETVNKPKVVVLAGKKYRDIIKKSLPDAAEFESPLENHSGIGEQISWLRSEVQDSQENLSQVSESR